MATNGTTTTTKIQIPRPAAPGVLSDNLRQNVSVYKAIRTLVDITNQTQGHTSLGSAATYATDGKPATFTQGGLDAVLIRVAPHGQGATLGLANEWIAGGGDTDIKHGLGRIPIGYWVVRSSQGVAISDGATAWTTTDIYFKTDHSDTDVTLMIF